MRRLLTLRMMSLAATGTSLAALAARRDDDDAVGIAQARRGAASVGVDLDADDAELGHQVLRRIRDRRHRIEFAALLDRLDADTELRLAADHDQLHVVGVSRSRKL